MCTQVDIFGLIASSTFAVSVFARNELAVSPKSQAVFVSTTAPSLPGIPPAPVVVAVTGGLIALEWVPPEDTGGVPVDSWLLFVDGIDDAISRTLPQTGMAANVVDLYVSARAASNGIQVVFHICVRF